MSCHGRFTPVQLVRAFHRGERDKWGEHGDGHVCVLGLVRGVGLPFS